MISPGGQPRRPGPPGGAELAHSRGGEDVVAGHVADDERDLAVLQRDDVEPVAAHLRGRAGRLVAVRDLQHLVEQVDGDAVGEFGHGQGGEFPGCVVNIEPAPDPAAGPLKQVGPGIGLPER
jgi:hypothetical protein